MEGKAELRMSIQKCDCTQPYECHAIGRFIHPDEIAELAYYLMSDYGEIVCGHTVVADGGDKHATL